MEIKYGILHFKEVQDNFQLSTKCYDCRMLYFKDVRRGLRTECEDIPQFARLLQLRDNRSHSAGIIKVSLFAFSSQITNIGLPKCLILK